MNFKTKLETSIEKNNSLLCIGLDTDISKIPQHLLKEKDPLFEFNKKIIDATIDLVCSYKLNFAFYESRGIDGAFVLKKTVNYIQKINSDIPIIADGKRADIGNTSEMYAHSVFDENKCDSVTVNPYLGEDSLEPFLKRSDKGIIVLCKTSNKGAQDFQDLLVDGMPLYLRVAEKVVAWDKKYNNCLLVVGATWPEELKKIREIAPNMFFLVPGIGAQGGDVEKTLQNGLRKDKSGLILTSSRAILYASIGEDFAQKAREKAVELRDQINLFRK